MERASRENLQATCVLFVGSSFLHRRVGCPVLDMLAREFLSTVRYRMHGGHLHPLSWTLEIKGK